MTNIKKVKEITIEVERVRVISNLKKEKSNCENCHCSSEFITVSMASQIFQIPEEFIAQLARENSVHLKLGINDGILVCLKSLMAARNS